MKLCFSGGLLHNQLLVIVLIQSIEGVGIVGTTSTKFSASSEANASRVLTVLSKTATNCFNSV